VYLCGACTYPGGSVIGINGRNAAMEILKGAEKCLHAPALPAPLTPYRTFCNNPTL
jgi:hypothetical protein